MYNFSVSLINTSVISFASEVNVVKPRLEDPGGDYLDPNPQKPESGFDLKTALIFFVSTFNAQIPRVLKSRVRPTHPDPDPQPPG